MSVGVLVFIIDVVIIAASAILFDLDAALFAVPPFCHHKADRVYYRGNGQSENVSLSYQTRARRLRKISIGFWSGA